MLTVPEVLFAVALGRRGKAEIMMAGKGDRSCSRHNKPGNSERLAGTRSHYNPQDSPLMTDFPHPAPLPVGFTASSCRISM